ncbi:MAG: hypothetical protein Q9195_007093 [Heterodermia aff. obscurata]
MPFTPIGSLGDVVALSLIIRDLIKALDDTKGSSVQYQEFSRKLWAFKRVVQEVETVCRKREDTVEMNALVGSICCVANQSRQCFKPFLKIIRSYRRSLSTGGSSNPVRDAFKKAQWWICRSDELSKLQTEIDDEKLHARLESSEEKNAITIKEQRLILGEIKNQLDENDKQIRAGNAMTSKIFESLGFDWIRSLSVDIRKFMRAIFMTTFATYKAVADTQGRLPSNLERCLYQGPFVLEDSHGRIKPIYLDCINSWDAFDAWLELQYRGHFGRELVQENVYVLHDVAGNRDIEHECPWETAFLPGHRVVMCMLFYEDPNVKHCPKCFSNSPALWRAPSLNGE